MTLNRAVKNDSKYGPARIKQVRDKGILVSRLPTDLIGVGLVAIQALRPLGIMANTTDKDKTDAQGIPLKSSHPNVSILVLYSAINVIFGLLGVAVAYFFAFKRGTEKAEAKISILAEYDLAYLYAGILVLKIGQLPIMILLGQARKESKADVPDQHVCESISARLIYWMVNELCPRSCSLTRDPIEMIR